MAKTAQDREKHNILWKIFIKSYPISGIILCLKMKDFQKIIA
jgi:hypothetical protein